MSEAERELWDDFCAAAPNSPILQTWEWGNSKAAFGWEPIRYAVKDEGQIVAGISILKRPLPIFKRAIFYAPRGPVLDFHDEALFRFLIDGIKQEAKQHRAVVLKVDPEVDEKDLGTVVIFKKMGFNFVRKQVQPRATLVVDLKPELDDILAGFEEKTRYNVKLSQKKGVAVKAMPNEEGVDIFYSIYRETAKRDNFLIHPREYYRKLYEELVKNGMAAILVAYFEDKPIAAIFNFCFGKKTWYMYGASSSVFRNLMPNHALHWNFIQWAKESGYETYDLWGVPANPSEKHPLWGVYRFKKGFSSRLVKWMGACDLPLNNIYYHMFDNGLKIWQSARSLIKKGRIIDSLSEE